MGLQQPIVPIIQFVRGQLPSLDVTAHEFGSSNQLWSDFQTRKVSHQFAELDSLLMKTFELHFLSDKDAVTDVGSDRIKKKTGWKEADKHKERIWRSRSSIRSVGNTIWELKIVKQKNCARPV